MSYPRSARFSGYHIALKKIAVIFLCLISTSLACAQSGNILVTVIDAQTQRPISTAAVQVIARDGLRRDMSVDSDGRLNIDELSAGLYAVIISHPKYQTSRSASVRVVDRKVTPLRVALSARRWDIEETIVIGEAVGVDRLGSAGSSYLDRESLRSAAGSGSDILRALDGLPGLFASGEFANFTVRGNGPRDNLILVDGIPFDNIVHFDESFGEQEDIEGGGRFSVFAPNLISGATFQPGGWSAAYGGRAGSLLQLEVAEGNPETPSYTVRLDIAGVEVGYDGPSRLFENTSVLFSARRLDFGQFFETIGVDDLGSPELTDIVFKSSTRLSAVDKLNLLAIYAPEDFTRDIDNVLASDEDDPGNFEDVELSESEADNSLLALTWSRLIGDDAEWVNRLYYRHYDESSTSGEAFPDLVAPNTPADEIPVRENIIVSSREETEIGWRSDFNTRNTLGQLSAGLRATHLDLAFDLNLDDDWIRYIYDEDDFRAEPGQRFIRLTPAAVNSRFEDAGVSYAAYLDQGFEFDNWELRAGLRYDRDRLAGESLVSPRFAAAWQLSDQVGLSATAGIYYQSPRFSDRASDTTNADVENEKITQYSLGLKYYLTPDIEILVEPYYQDLDNLVVEQDSVNQTVGNSGEGRSYGVDAAITRRFDDGWSANFNYSYNDARVRDGKGLAFYDADFSRPHFVSLGGIWEISARWKLSARWKWASGAPRDEFIVFDNVLGDGQPLRFSKQITSTNTDRYESYNSLNFRADYRRAFGRTNVIAFIDIINVYGADNPGSSEFNERTGEDVIEEGESLPLVGFRLEW